MTKLIFVPTYTMDALAILPVEVLPRLLMTPSCAVAVKLTCKRYYTALAVQPFNLITQVLWVSEYWEVHITKAEDIDFICVQCGYTCGGAVDQEQLRRLDRKKSTYIWLITHEGKLNAVNMATEWGSIHVEDPARIFHKVGCFSGGKLDVDDIMKDLPGLSAGFDAIVQYRVDPAHEYQTIGGNFDVISRFTDAAAEVILFRRR